MNTDPPIYRALAAALGHPNGSHHYRDDPPDTEEVPIMGRHHDLDGNGVADHAEQPPDHRDVHAHGDDACDQEQEQPDRWVGVQRDPDSLPVEPDGESS